MAQVAFVISIPKYPAAALGDFVAQGYQLAQLINKDVPADSVALLTVTKSDKNLVPDVFANITAAPPSNPLGSRSGKITTTRQSLAGGAAGAHTLGTAVATTDEVVAVFHSDDTTHVVTDKTSEYTITGTTTIDNTGGTSSVGGHIIVVTRNT